ncbi:MAG: helix-turn-helix domain-containing protein [Alphaproteobacteria bacterium]
MQREAGDTATMVRPGQVGDGARSRHRGVGGLLRETREASGEDLRRIATRLRIRHPYLEAIEDGRFDKLPGMPYAIGFVRAYAEHLGLDGAEMVRRFKQETACVDSRTDLVFPEPPPERGVPGGAILLIALALAVLGYGGWYYVSTRDDAPPELIAAVPPRFETSVAPAPADPPPAPQTASNPPAPAASIADARQPEPVRDQISARPEASQPAISPPTSTAATAPAPPTIVAVAPPAPPTVAPPTVVPSGAETSAVTTDPRGTDSVRAAAPAVPPPPPAAAAATRSSDALPSSAAAADPEVETGRLFGAAPTESRVQIRAVSDSWVQVRDADGSLLLTRVLRTGDVYRVPDRSGVTMRTGNAGGLEVSVDGRMVAPIGPPGSVRRNVALDADRLIAGTAAAD